MHTCGVPLRPDKPSEGMAAHMLATPLAEIFSYSHAYRASVCMHVSLPIEELLVNQRVRGAIEGGPRVRGGEPAIAGWGKAVEGMPPHQILVEGKQDEDNKICVIPDTGGDLLQNGDPHKTGCAPTLW